MGNTKESVAEGRKKSADLRKYFDGMTTLQLRQFFKSTDIDSLKKIMRNLLWAIDANSVESEMKVECRIEKLKGQLALEETKLKEVKEKNVIDKETYKELQETFKLD